MAGARDALDLVRESAAAIPDDRRTQTVTSRQLDGAIEALASALDTVPDAPAGWARWLATLDGLAHTLVDVAGTLDAERGDGAAAELLAWSRAIAATVQSYARDVDTLLPWTRLASADNAGHSLFDTLPAPAEMADRCATALAELAGNPGDAEPGPLVGRLERAANDCGTLVRRLLALARRARELCERHAVRLPSRSHAQPARRSAIASPRAIPTPTATTSSPPRRGWPASSPSPRATCRPRIGSSSGVP